MEPLSFLEKLRSRYLETEDESLLFTGKQCEIEGKEYKLNSWRDFHGSDQLVIFELKINSILATESTCIGIRYSDSGQTHLLNNEALWDIGIP